MALSLLLHLLLQICLQQASAGRSLQDPPA
jgi:hypothetical protein